MVAIGGESRDDAIRAENGRCCFAMAGMARMKMIFRATRPVTSVLSIGMQILPVIDLLGGVVVRGIAGRRAEYRPIVSRLVDRPDPLEIARAFRRELGLDTLYVADLDAILHGCPNWDVYRGLADEGFSLWIDAGLRDVLLAEKLLVAGAGTVIAGLETCSGPELLEALCASIGAERLAFSLDLHAGRPLGELSSWETSDPREITARGIAAGIRRLIVLDLAHVGANTGVATIELCRQLRTRHPHLELITGGGVRAAGDLADASGWGVDGILIASALHDGRLTRQDLAMPGGESGGLEQFRPENPG
jgi:phosphoribosylformimino-5-aminoimidazole carboxamide ribotide isomerase